MKWGTEDFEEDEQPRPEFELDQLGGGKVVRDAKSPIDGSTYLFFPP